MALQTVRPPAVAGLFYPSDAGVLHAEVQSLLAAARPVALTPKALIAPHAGYIYSGPVAASAYALLTPLAGRIERVVLLGPVHRVWVAGLALPGVTHFETPLGRVALDPVAVDVLSGLPQVETSASAHATEHSLEVHLPFLQTVLRDFTLVPLAVGGATPEQVAEALEAVWGGDETLIVVSSDLSHFHAYDTARALDAATVDAILHGSTRLVGDMACGAHPINGLMLAAQHKGLTPHLLDLRNSGDTAGDKQRVVGYAAFALTGPTPS